MEGTRTHSVNLHRQCVKPSVACSAKAEEIPCPNPQNALIILGSLHQSRSHNIDRRMKYRVHQAREHCWTVLPCGTSSRAAGSTDCVASRTGLSVDGLGEMNMISEREPTAELQTAQMYRNGTSTGASYFRAGRLLRSTFEDRQASQRYYRGSVYSFRIPDPNRRFKSLWDPNIFPGSLTLLVASTPFTRVRRLGRNSCRSSTGIDINQPAPLRY